MGSGCRALDQIVDGRVAVQAELERERGGLPELLGAEVLDQAQHPECLADDLPGMTLAAELALEDLARGGAHPLGPGEQIVDTELAIGAMLRWPMRLDGQALIAASGPRMASNQGAALEDLDRMSAEARIDALTDQGVVDG